MNYLHVYNLLMTAARTSCRDKTQSYYEQHHVIPRSWGGLDTADNLVLLTAREHYVAHHLLYRAHPRDEKMALAFFMLVNVSGKRISARRYESLKIAAWPAMAASSLANGYKSRDDKTGFHALTPEQRSANSRQIGIAMRTRGTGLFAATPEERVARSKRAGKTSGQLAVKRKTGVHAMAPEELLESRQRGGKTAAAKQPPEKRQAASTAGSEALRRKARAQYETALLAAGLTAESKPTRQEAKQLSLNKYYGSVCAKHPELEGFRYTRAVSPCVACVREQTQARRHITPLPFE